MQIFHKLLLIVLFLTKIVSGGLESDNTELKINEINFSDSGNADLSTLIKHAIKYFNDLNQKYHNKINEMAGDISSIKNLLQSDSTKPALETPLKTKENSTRTVPEAAKGLYDNLWVVIQRRQEGTVSFYRSWIHYVVGFGHPFREFFIGLDKLHYLTSSRPHQLIIKLEDFKGHMKYALYDEFLVGNSSEKYQLKKLGNYSGTAGDYLRDHEGMFFSTRDKDNDASERLHCAKVYQGGWWYNNCMTSNLNGPFRTRYENNIYNMTWGRLNGTQHKIVQMMIRSKQ